MATASAAFGLRWLQTFVWVFADYNVRERLGTVTFVIHF